MKLLIMLLLLLGVASCSSQEMFYNPYENPHAQSDYQMWVSEQDSDVARAEDFFENQNSWDQTFADREGAYRNYIETYETTNDRFDTVQDRNRLLRYQFFEESVGVFNENTEEKERKGLTIIEKRTLYDLEQLKFNQKRYNLFLQKREAIRNKQERQPKQEQE